MSFHVLIWICIYLLACITPVSAIEIDQSNTYDNSLILGENSYIVSNDIFQHDIQECNTSQKNKGLAEKNSEVNLNPGQPKDSDSNKNVITKYLICAFIVLCILYALFEYKVYNIEKELAAVQELRPFYARALNLAIAVRNVYGPIPPPPNHIYWNRYAPNIPDPRHQPMINNVLGVLGALREWEIDDPEEPPRLSDIMINEIYRAPQRYTQEMQALYSNNRHYNLTWKLYYNQFLVMTVFVAVACILIFYLLKLNKDTISAKNKK